MTEPRTKAGRALLADVRRDESTLAGMAVSPGIRFGPQFFEALESAILAIETEADRADSSKNPSSPEHRSAA